MKVTVFGATGRTGQHVVEEALKAGHNVKALARTPAKLAISHPDLEVVQGDVLEPERVDEAVAGADAVISVLGPVNNEPTYTISQGMAHILKAMRAHDVKRLIVSVGAGVRMPQDKPGLFDRLISLVLKLIARHVYEDMRRVAERVRESDRAWTLVRVPMLTEDPGRGNIHAGYLGQGTGPRLSRQDMASFIVRQLEDERYLHEAPVISSRK